MTHTHAAPARGVRLTSGQSVGKVGLKNHRGSRLGTRGRKVKWALQDWQLRSSESSPVFRDARCGGTGRRTRAPAGPQARQRVTACNRGSRPKAQRSRPPGLYKQVRVPGLPACPPWPTDSALNKAVSAYMIMIQGCHGVSALRLLQRP